MKWVLDGLSRALQIDVLYYIKGSFWAGVGQLSFGLLRFLQLLILAHLVDKQFFGEFQFILSVLAVVLVSSLPGIDTAIVQSVSNGYGHSLISGVSAKIRWSLFGSLALLLTAVFFKFFMPLDFWHVFAFAALVFPLYAGFAGVASYYRGKEDFRSAALCEVVINLAGFAGVMVVLFVQSLLAMTLSMMLLVAFVSWVLYARAASKVSGASKDAHLVSYGVNLTLMSLMAYVAMYVDRFIVAGLLGFENLAVYSIAVSITLFLALSGRLFGMVLLPKMSRARPDQIGRIKRVFWLFFLVVAGFSALVALSLPFVWPFLFSKYAEALPYAQFSMAYAAFFLPSSVLLSYFQGQKKTKLLYAYNISSGILSLVLLAVLVPFFGIWGAVSSKIILGILGFAFTVIAFYVSCRR
jgi:O-antigen/teichoic acid export membrane protein